MNPWCVDSVNLFGFATSLHVPDLLLSQRIAGRVQQWSHVGPVSVGLRCASQSVTTAWNWKVMTLSIHGSKLSSKFVLSSPLPARSILFFNVKTNAKEMKTKSKSIEHATKMRKNSEKINKQRKIKYINVSQNSRKLLVLFRLFTFLSQVLGLFFALLFFNMFRIFTNFFQANGKKGDKIKWKNRE